MNTAENCLRRKYSQLVSSKVWTEKSLRGGIFRICFVGKFRLRKVRGDKLFSIYSVEKFKLEKVCARKLFQFVQLKVCVEELFSTCLVKKFVKKFESTDNFLSLNFSPTTKRKSGIVNLFEILFGRNILPSEKVCKFEVYPEFICPSWKSLWADEIVFRKFSKLFVRGKFWDFQFLPQKFSSWKVWERMKTIAAKIIRSWKDSKFSNFRICIFSVVKFRSWKVLWAAEIFCGRVQIFFHSQKFSRSKVFVNGEKFVTTVKLNFVSGESFVGIFEIISLV